MNQSLPGVVFIIFGAASAVILLTAVLVYRHFSTSSTRHSEESEPSRDTGIQAIPVSTGKTRHRVAVAMAVLTMVALAGIGGFLMFHRVSAPPPVHELPLSLRLLVLSLLRQ